MPANLAQREETTMLRNVKRVRCPHCRHVFLAFDIEDNASMNSMITHCPKCHKSVRINWNRMLGLLPDILRKIESTINKNDVWI